MPSPSECAAVADSPSKLPPALAQLFSAIGQLSTLPSIAQQIMSLADSQDSEAEDLRQVLQRDPALAARILRQVNSGYYGLSNKVSDLRTAISLMGFREIRNLALTVFVARMFRCSAKGGLYQRESLWDHCQCVAVASRLVARMCERGSPSEAYLAGLLHDVGVIAIDQALHKHFCKVLERLHKPGQLAETCVVEREMLGFDHAQLGADLAERWMIPPVIANAIRWHHDAGAYHGQAPELVDVVNVADYLCCRAGRPALGVQNTAPPSDSVYSRLGLTELTLKILWRELPEALDKAQLLKIV